MTTCGMCGRRGRVALGLVVLALCARVWGDGGSIPFIPKAKVFEPTQRAFIAWSGDEEILVLSTDLKASEPTKVLEVFPFPSEPKVTKGDLGIFPRATDLINAKLRGLAGFAGGNDFGPGGDFGGDGREEPPPARVTFHKTIGAHDVAVIQALKLDGFIVWVQKYLRSQNVDSPVIPGPLAEIVEQYIWDGITWFVFDVVSLTDQPVTKQALQFRFRSNCLYYPLRITRTEVGNTVVKLLICTTELVNLSHGMGYGIPQKRLRLAHQPVTIDAADVRDLSPEVHGLLGRPRKAKLRIWEIHGELSRFERDLVIVNPAWRLHHGRDTALPRTGGDWR